MRATLIQSGCAGTVSSESAPSYTGLAANVANVFGHLLGRRPGQCSSSLTRVFSIQESGNMNPLRQLRTRLLEPLRLQVQARYFQRQDSASQVGQDWWVFGEAFNGMTGGYFCDVGAADGMAMSNTFLLEKKYRWRGICIEASPLLFETLRRVRSVTCVNVCVDSEEREIDFSLRGMFGGIAAHGTDNDPQKTYLRQCDMRRMKTSTLASILEVSHAPEVIDYLSVDVEGAEDRVLCSFPFEKYCFKCMTIERPKPALVAILGRRGYVSVRAIPGLDVFYVHESFLSTYARNVSAFWASRGTRK